MSWYVVHAGRISQDQQDDFDYMNQMLEGLAQLNYVTIGRWVHSLPEVHPIYLSSILCISIHRISLMPRLHGLGHGCRLALNDSNQVCLE